MALCSSTYGRRISTAAFACGVIAACAIGAAGVSAQNGPIPGQSVNMVAGTDWPDGDPFLQRQNEGSMAVSTRNPLHILGGGNDYRTVDIPGLPDGSMSGDAWNGVFWSRDGGHRWKSTLLPGYPQDTSPEGLASPIHGLQAGADAVIRAGANGMMFYVGIAFNRDAITQSASAAFGGGKTGKVFISRFIDDNARETGNPFRYLETQVVDNGSEGRFLDKPWLAVDKPRAGAGACSIPGDGEIGPQTFASGNVYVAYTTFVGKSDTTIRTKVMFARSSDCGRTWSTQKLSEGYPVNQGAVIAVEPNSGAVYVAWRRFRSDKGDPDGFLIAKSVDGGRTFTKAIDLVTFTPYTLAGSTTEVSRIFEQGTSIASFRTTGFPALAVDGNGVVYAAWAERSIGPMAASRIMMRRSADGLTWTETAFPVDNSGAPGHQMMPSMMFHAGRVSLTYYNLVEDHTVGFLDLIDGKYNERRVPAGDLADATPVLQRVFNDFAADFAPAGFGTLKRRHTIDLWLADAAPAPPFTAMNIGTTRVSQYVYGSGPDPSIVQQFQYNPPNFPLFACQGALENCKAFFGDYIDLAGAPALVPDGIGGWTYNTNTSTARVFHTIWTDNRDVRPPADGISWHLYAPPRSPFNDGMLNRPSLFDPNQTRPTCTPGVPGFTPAGMRNQNLYTARLTEGLVAGSPQNSKPLGLTTIDSQTVLLQRAFVVFVQNTTDELKTFRLTIANQPAGVAGRASFLQFEDPPLTTLYVNVPAKSTATRTVFVTSGDRDASVTVLVEEVDAVGELPTGDGLEAVVVLNPDITNPDITNPDITNPDITNPDITNAEVYNPDITNPDITNPDITNPDITNPDITNPDITNPDITNPDITNVQIFNPDITNPDITNPDITNPDITNPDITNPDITNGTIAEATWTVTDTGNTTGGYKVKLLVNGEVPSDFKAQLVIHRGHSTPVAVNCELAVQRQAILVANIPNPEFTNILSPDITNPDITNPDITNATLHVGPGEDWAQLTLTLIDTVPGNGGPSPLEFLETSVTPAIVAHAVNTVDVLAGSTTPPVSLPPSRRVVFLVPPAGGEADEPISPAVQVQVRDEFSRPVEGATVILSLGSGPEGAELGGNQAVTDDSGIAQFPALTVSPDGVYSLIASVDGEQPPDPAVSAPFIITDSCGLDDGLVAIHSVVDSPSSSDVIKSRIANFDGDPYPDLAVLHLNGTLTKMAGDGLGGFERRVRITLAPGREGSPNDLAVADFNNDGLDDVVASFPTEDLLATVLSDLNSPDTYFSDDATTRAFGVEGGPTALAAGRFRRFNVPADEDFDLAVAATTDNTVWLLDGDSEGGFVNRGSFADLFGPVALAAGDMDGDGVDDLAVATRGNGDNIGPAASVLLSSLFYEDEVPSVPGGSAPAGVTPSGVTIADFNNDGHNDVAVVSAGLVIAGDDVNIAGDVRVLHGDSAGHLQPASLDAKTLVVLPGRPVSVAAADVNADGFPDLAIANLSNLLVSVRESTGGYAPPVAFVAGNTPVHVVAGDVNGDGLADSVVANREADDSGDSTVSVFLTRCGTSLADVSVAMAEAPAEVEPGDSVMYQTTVTNNGPSMATNVTLTQSFNGTLVRALSTAGECDAGSPVTCGIGELAPGASEIVSVEVTAPDEGPMTSRVTVRANQTDLSPANNTATATTNVNSGPIAFVVDTTDDQGVGSLRFALELANDNPGVDTIVFAIPGEAPHVIALASPLPAIIEPVHIDAMPAGDCALPTVEVDGTAAGAETNGFVVAAGFSTIRGLAITGFRGAGIRLQGGSNSVLCNHIGIRADGATGAGNNEGVAVFSDSNSIDGNVISGNQLAGVSILGAGAIGNTITRNHIGLNRAGTEAVPNVNGVDIGNAPSNNVGGPGGMGNVISGNSNAGIGITGAAATGNVVQGNRLGTNAAGALAIPNVSVGLLIDGAGNNIIGGTTGTSPGGMCTGACNLISGNGIPSQRAGVILQNEANDNLLQGNYIGTDISGTFEVSNWWGLNIEGSSGNTIGGNTADARNVISGNINTGIRIVGSDSNAVKGNYIGVDRTGAAALGNANQGIRVDNGVGNVIGGLAAGEGNVVSANGSAGDPDAGGHGIRLHSSSTVVEGNFIGTDVSGTIPLGNVHAGVAVFGDQGGNRITRNTIFANGGLGIDLDVDGVAPADGVTPNDDDDADGGPNDLQNFPLLDQATPDGEGGVTVRGFLNSTRDTAVTLDFYHSPACDPSGNGEGLTWLGSLEDTTNEAGNLSFAEAGVPLANVPDGGFITATATGPGGTSEFSPCIAAPGGSVDVNLAPAGAGVPTEAPEDFNQTRAARVIVMTPTPIDVVSMTLNGLDIGPAESASVGARIYDEGGELIASGDATIFANGPVTVPVSAALQPETTYRVAFFVQTSGPQGTASSLFLLPTELPYQAAPAGVLLVGDAWQGDGSGDIFPGVQTNRVPLISVAVKGS